VPHVGALTFMLEGNGAYVSLGVYIEYGVFSVVMKRTLPVLPWLRTTALTWGA
jgi:hypothetical protein